MKKILFIFICVIVTSCNSQPIEDPLDNTHEILRPHVESFIKEANKRGYYPTETISKMDTIGIINDPFILGVYIPDLNIIFIEEATLNDANMREVVVFHELFHGVYKLGHCHQVPGPHLMCAGKPLNFKFSDWFCEDSIWQDVLDKEFNRIK